MIWLLFVVGIFADGSIGVRGIEAFDSEQSCMMHAAATNAKPDLPPLMWSHANCISMPEPRTVTKRGVKGT